LKHGAIPLSIRFLGKKQK